MREKELPLALRALATELSINPSFEESLWSLEKGYGELSEDIKKIHRQTSQGLSIQEAILEWAEKSKSRQVKRAAMQIIFSYENHGNPENLKQLSQELLEKQKNRMQEYSKKIVVYSLVFICVSAVLPALFQAYVIVGTSFMSQTVTPEQAFFIPVIGFPLIDGIVLLAINSKRP